MENPTGGAGMDEDIIKASIHALTVAVNKLPQIQSDEKCLDEPPGSNDELYADELPDRYLRGNGTAVPPVNTVYFQIH